MIIVIANNINTIEGITRMTEWTPVIIGNITGGTFPEKNIGTIII